MAQSDTDNLVNITTPLFASAGRMSAEYATRTKIPFNNDHSRGESLRKIEFS